MCYHVVLYFDRCSVVMWGRIIIMPKRFIDTGILKHHFLRGCKAPLKLLWLHLLTDCNNAGIWQVDFEIAEIVIGSKIDRKKVDEKFAKKVIVLKDGVQWFLPDFIEYQYGFLQPNNPAHKNVIILLQKEGLIDENLKVVERCLVVPLEGTLVKVKEKDKEKTMDKEKEKHENLIFPFDSENFKNTWDVLTKEKKWRNKSFSALQSALKKLSNFPEPEAIQMIENTIAGEWQGLFEINHIKNGTVTKTTDDLRTKAQRRRELENADLKKFAANAGRNYTD